MNSAGWSGRSGRLIATVEDVELQVPSVHPNVSEPLLDDAGFSIELWCDWPLGPGDLAAYQRAVQAADDLDLDTGNPDRKVQAQVSIDDGALWVSVYVTGPGSADDEAWAFADSAFQRIWAAVHTQAQSAA